LCRADPGTQPHFYPKTPPVKNQPTPPPKRRRVVVQGQQLKRLENRAQRDGCRLTMKPKRGNSDVFNPSELLNENKQ
jgi:hypothetical protein